MAALELLPTPATRTSGTTTVLEPGSAEHELREAELDRGALERLLYLACEERVEAVAQNAAPDAIAHRARLVGLISDRAAESNLRVMRARIAAERGRSARQNHSPSSVP